ncbi:MAG TPA: hypothetical protein VE988_14670, partial [Gemmataceae bacterium]|nr:hypothetical protein [Gemmataceae bacterium]
RKMVEKLECKMERTLGKEILKIAGQLTPNHAVDGQKRTYQIHEKKLEGGKPCVVSLESFKGAAWFDTFLRIEDADGKVLAEDDDSGVDLNAMVVFTPPQTGVYRIFAISFQPGATGNYLLVVRQ